MKQHIVKIDRSITLMLFSSLVLLPVQLFCQTHEGNRKFLGNIIGSSIPADFGKYWSQVTPENAGKWGVVGISPDTNLWDWSQLDRIYDYALQKGYPFKFHNLVWGQQQPSWTGGLDLVQQKKMVEAWIRLCGERYSKSTYVDVVNEPIQKPAFYKNALGAMAGQVGIG